MKTLILTIFLTTFYACNRNNSALSKDKEINNNKEVKILDSKIPSNNMVNSKIDFLEKFYNEYVNEFEKPNASQNAINMLLKKYCTQNLLNKLSNSEIDYDPFINAQDVTSDLLKTLEIKTDNLKNEGFIISYIDSYSKEKVIIKVVVIENEGNYFINEIN